MPELPDRELTDSQLERYARHVVLPEVGEEGQLRLLSSSVLVVGAGGLGAPLIQYLAAAGIGRLGIVDDDSVDLSNLQRQIIHRDEDIGRPKAESARLAIERLDPALKVDVHQTRLDASNALDLISRYDLVADGSDNFATRYLVNDASYLAGKTLVSAAVMRFEGQISTFRAHRHDGTPCYRCLFGEQFEDPKQSCADVGVLGALPGVLGSMQALEVVKELLGIGESLSGRLVLYDALAASFRTIKAKADPSCPLCGPQATIKELKAENYVPRICAA